MKLLSRLKVKPLKILLVAAEASPYANVGGFARVVEALSRELLNLGHDVRVFMPKYGSIDEEKYKTKIIIESLKVPTSDPENPELICNVKMTKFDNGPITYFLENMEYYEKRANVYGYSDDPTRWALLSRGALEFLRNVKNAKDEGTKNFVPDIIHCNEWHTGLTPNYLRTVYKNDPVLNKCATLFTIHNLQIQGVVDFKFSSELDFDDGKSDIATFFSENLPKQNFMKRGIIYSDAINTVSPTYSHEVLTPEFGASLDRLLTEVKSKFFGILNGIDYESFNPETDTFIEKNFDAGSIPDRLYNKEALIKEFGLENDLEKPIIGFVGRLDYQKGVDLVAEAMSYLLKDFPVQFVCVGGGEPALIDGLRVLKEKFPKNVGLHLYPNFTLPRLVFSGADMLLFPSRFEPCGIVQLEAMRYGAVPIIRRVGGLADSVENFDCKYQKGTGFVFEDFNLIAFYGQLVRAVETFKHKEVWLKIQQNAMRKDFSWSKSALEYVKVYNRAKEFLEGRL